MANNLEITIYDFEDICRTCLSRENLKPLYEKSYRSTSLVDMLMFCTAVKFSEDDGLPLKICSNCINDINQVFSFTKRCETTDTILRECIKKVKTELTDNSSEFQKEQPINVANEEIKIKSEIRRAQEVLEDVKYVEKIHLDVEEVMLKTEYDVISEFQTELPINEANEDMQIKAEITSVEEVLEDFAYVEERHLEVEEVILKTEFENETCDIPAEECYEDDEEEVIFCGILDNSGHDSINSQIEEEISNSSNLHSETNDPLLPVPTLSRDFQSEYERAIKTKTLLQFKFQCHVCQEYFVNKRILYDHIQVHKPGHICDVCGKQFKYLSNLERHKRTHKSGKPYVCSVCNKAYRHLSKLKIHMNMCIFGRKKLKTKVSSRAGTSNTRYKSKELLKLMLS